MSERKLAVVTGASTGIGRELALLCARDGHDLLVAADEAGIANVRAELGVHGVKVETVETDLATIDGIDRLIEQLAGRPVDFLLANAGRGLGHGFMEQDFSNIRRVIDTNVTGTVYLVQKIGRQMVARGQGRILFTGSIAGFMPGTYQAIYNATKAFIDSFSIALRHELQDSGVSVTCLMPGPTDTRFFERAGMEDTKVAQDDKSDPADVAKDGYDAMMSGEAQVVSGWKNKLQVAAAHVTPSGQLAEQHRKMAEPGSGNR